VSGVIAEEEHRASEDVLVSRSQPSTSKNGGGVQALEGSAMTPLVKAF